MLECLMSDVHCPMQRGHRTLDIRHGTCGGHLRGGHWIHLKYMLTGIAAKSREMMMLNAEPVNLMIGE